MTGIRQTSNWVMCQFLTAGSTEPVDCALMQGSVTGEDGYQMINPNTNIGRLQAVTSSSSSNDQIGAVIDGSGDLDGDGYNDLLVGMTSYGSVSEGATFFFYGPPSGTSTLTEDADAIFVGTNSSDNVGSDVHFVGNVDGSGTSAILVDVPEDDNNPSSVSNAGAAYLIFGFGL